MSATFASLEEERDYWKACLLAAVDVSDAGIYPASYNGVPRDEWKDGFNEGASQVEEKLAEFVDKCVEPSADWPMRVHLMGAGQAFFGSQGFAALCSDIFAWGCADAECVTDEELPDLYAAWKADNKWGAAKWCCLKRNQKPQAPVERDMRADGAWDEAMEALPENRYDAARREYHAKKAAEAVACVPDPQP